MCTVRAALFLFLSFSVSVPLCHPSHLRRFCRPSLCLPVLFFVSQPCPFSFSLALFHSSFPNCLSLSVFPSLPLFLSLSFSLLLCVPFSFSCYLFVFRALSIFLLSSSPDFFSLLYSSAILLPHSPISSITGFSLPTLPSSVLSSSCPPHYIPPPSP